MTTATVTPSKSGKPAKFRRDHKINSVSYTHLTLPTNSRV